MDCPAGQYMDIFFTCQACGESCATCANGVSCLTCADGYTYEEGLCCQAGECSGSSGGGTEPEPQPEWTYIECPTGEFANCVLCIDFPADSFYECAKCEVIAGANYQLVYG